MSIRVLDNLSRVIALISYFELTQHNRKISVDAVLLQIIEPG